MTRAAWGSLALSLACGACDPANPRSAPADARDDGASGGARAAKEEPPDGLGPGCRRAGPIAGVELDEACVVASADPAETVLALAKIAMALSADGKATVGGGQLQVRLSLTNTAKRPVAIVLEGEPPGAGPHPDWSLLAGMQPPRATQTEGYRTRFVVRTLDPREISVDQLRLVSPPTPPPVRLYRVILAPQASLTHAFQWLALGIPAPYAPFEDDAGHRIVPKTAPRPLSAGKYTVVVDVPFHGVAAPQRGVTTTVEVLAGGG